MSGSLRALLVAFALVFAVGVALDFGLLALAGGVAMVVVLGIAWAEVESSAPQTAAELVDAIRCRAQGAERDLERKRAAVLTADADDRQVAIILQDQARREVERCRAALEVASDLRWGD